MQYDVLNIITKAVQIDGIIFMVSLDQLDQLKQSKETLKMLFANRYLPKKLSLFVLYNRSSENKEKYEWMSLELFNNQLGVDDIKEKFSLKYFGSCFHDCNLVENTLNSPDQLSTKLQEFANSFNSNA